MKKHCTKKTYKNLFHDIFGKREQKQME
jgi:hypothetical protein